MWHMVWYIAYISRNPNTGCCVRAWLQTAKRSLQRCAVGGEILGQRSLPLQLFQELLETEDSQLPFHVLSTFKDMFLAFSRVAAFRQLHRLFTNSEAATESFNTAPADRKPLKVFSYDFERNVATCLLCQFCAQRLKS